MMRMQQKSSELVVARSDSGFHIAIDEKGQTSVMTAIRKDRPILHVELFPIPPTTGPHDSVEVDIRSKVPVRITLSLTNIQTNDENVAQPFIIRFQSR